MGALAPITIELTVSSSIPANSEVTNSVTVSGGGVPVTSVSQTIEVDPSPTLPFGVADLTNVFSSLDGEPDTQAADHPSGLTSNFDVTTSPSMAAIRMAKRLKASQAWKDIVVDLPPGRGRNPQVAAQCPLSNELVAS